MPFDVAYATHSKKASYSWIIKSEGYYDRPEDRSEDRPECL